MATLREAFDALVKEVRRIGKKLDAIRGPNVSNKPDSITIGAPPSAQSVGLAPTRPGTFRVDVVYNSGTLGNRTTTPAATYNVKYPVGSTNVIGTNISVDSGRARLVKATIVAGTLGLAYYSGTNVALWDVNETYTQSNCP